MQTENIRKNDYWVEMDHKYRAQVRKTRSIVLEKGRGVEVWDVEGKKYLDFESGQMAMAAGHSHPVVLERIREQIELLMQNSIRVLNVPRVLLAKKLFEIVPEPLAKSFFLSTGSECEDHGLLLGGGIPTGGLGTNTIRLCPPLVITEEQVDTALNILKGCLQSLHRPSGCRKDD